MNIKKYFNSFCNWVSGIKENLIAKHKELSIQREKNEYDKLCQSFTFCLDPYEHPDTYLSLKGSLYRVQFSKEGVSITDSNGDDVLDKLTRLKVLNGLQELTNE